MTTTTARKPLTDATWADFQGRLTTNSREFVGWPTQADLQHQLVELAPHLDIDQARLLVSFVVSGMPLVLTWDTRMHLGRPVIERHRTTVLVTELIAPSPTCKAQPGRIRIRYSGFCHDVYLPQIVNVEPVATETTFIDIPEED